MISRLLGGLILFRLLIKAYGLVVFLGSPTGKFVIRRVSSFICYYTLLVPWFVDFFDLPDWVRDAQNGWEWGGICCCEVFQFDFPSPGRFDDQRSNTALLWLASYLFESFVTENDFGNGNSMAWLA